VTMSMAQTVTATFVMSFAFRSTWRQRFGTNQHAHGISCPDLQREFCQRTSVTLSASAAPGSLFTGWSGAELYGNGQLHGHDGMAQSYGHQPEDDNHYGMTVSTPRRIGTTVTFTARVSPTSGSATPTGTVAFSNDRARSASLPVGSHLHHEFSRHSMLWSGRLRWRANFATSSSARAAIAVGGIDDHGLAIYAHTGREDRWASKT